MSDNDMQRCEACGETCAEAHSHIPCWGAVFAYEEIPTEDDSYTWVHMCERHAALADGAPDPSPDE